MFSTLWESHQSYSSAECAGWCYVIPMHITECCGKNACRSCITKVAEDGGSCPIPGCGSQTVKINFNRGLRSNILESSVYCQSKGAGCGWVGKLDELSTHLKECPFMEEECQYHCGVHVHQTSNK